MAFTAPEAIKASNANLCGSTSIKPSRVLDLFYCDKESAKGSIVPTKKRRADTMMSDRDKMAKGGSSPQFLGTYPDVPNPHICPGSSELLEQQRGTVYPPQVLDHYVCEKASTKRSIVPTNKRKANDIIMSNKDKIAKAESTQQILGTGPCAPNHHNCPECPSQVEGSFMGDDDCDAHEFDSHLKKEMASITAAEAIRVSDATLPMKSSRVLHSTKRSMLIKKGKANDTIMSVRDKMASDGSTLQVVEIDHICPESSKALGKQQGVVYMPQVDAPSMGHEAEGSDVDSSLRSYPMKSAKVQFFVKILKKTLSVQKVLNELTVQELIDLSCHIIGVKSDLHAFFAGKPLHPNDLLSKYDICKDSTVHITAGLLGGQRVNFDTTFDVTEETLFDFIELPENLQNPLIIDRDQQMFTYVVKLKRFARRRIKKIIKFFTAKHRAGVCFDGEFERNDIFFEGEEVSLGVNVVALEFFEKGCERDYQKLAVHLGVIHTNDGQFSQYYIQLLSYLGRCPAGGRSRLKPAIAFLIHHPALTYYHDHFMKIHLLANINFRVLDENHGTVIEEAMPDMAEWMSDVMLCPEIERILYHNSYE